MIAVPRVDAHQHFWQYRAADHPWIDDDMAVLRRDFLPADLLPELAASGIDRTIAVQVRQSRDETRWLLELAAEYPFVAGVVGWVDLQSERVTDDLAALAADPRLVGIRHVVQSEPDDTFMLRPEFCRGLRALGSLGLVYDILIYPRHLPVAAEMVSRLEGQRFVLDHAAKPDIRRAAMTEWARDLRRLSEAPNVSCKLSGLVTEADWNTWTARDLRPYLDVAFECFGPDRLIAGSDWPVCTLAADYGRTISVVNDYLAPRPAAERDAVLGGNAMRVWRLPADAAPEARAGHRGPAEHTQ
jgi:L-fuconolactonase